MKKWMTAALVLITTLAARADEGMWLPHLIGQQRYADMKAKGLKLTAEDLYSINKSSIKDAIIIFGSGCTGEIVSPNGLIFTNHHCGYDAIAGLSTVQSNYLRDGFYAKNYGEELPYKGLSATFLVRIEDVTKTIMDSLAGLSWEEQQKRKPQLFRNVAASLTQGTSHTARVYSMFKDNQFLAYVYEVYNDVRLVGTPPESVGKFGGDTDNWEWPRHTGDFSIFRVYTAPDGKAADYSKDNVPMKSKRFLPISLKGVKEGDFSMIFGYPGSTNRFETSYGVKLATDEKNPAFVDMRDIRLKAMFEEMKKDPAVKLQLASNYASLANYWKFFDGETKQLLKYGVYEEKKKNEAALAQWIKQNNKSEYANLWSDYERAYAAWSPYAKHKEYYEQGITGPAVIKLANLMESIETGLLKSDPNIKATLKRIDDTRTASMKGTNLPSEQQMTWRLLQAFHKGIVPDQQPVAFYTALKQNYGPLNEDNTYKTFVANAFTNSLVTNDAKWKAFMADPQVGALQQDPMYLMAKAFRDNWKKYQPALQTFNDRNAELGNKYLKAYREMNSKKTMYPDANFSMRVSYGKVAGYKPRDGVRYDLVTTSGGLLEKYKPGDYEFDLPTRQIELLRKKDFGQYADPVRKDLIVGFLTTDDITGGNSGSPVLNGNGELIGLAFDGNYEALSHKININPEMTRTICVDIRYVLWCIDKLGGAPNIISELKLVK